MPLPLFPPPEEKEIYWRSVAKKFADEVLRPIALEDDEQCRFRRETFDELARRGLPARDDPGSVAG